MKLVLAMFACSMCLADAAANPQIFYGEDQGPGWNEAVRIEAFPNAEAARAAFVATCGHVGTEDLESLALNASAPLQLDFDGPSASLTGRGAVTYVPVQTYAGTFPTSGNQYWLVDNQTAPFILTFVEPVPAFGFYATDICDFWGTVSVNLSNGSSYVLGDARQRVSGGVMFFGVVSFQDPFTSVAIVPDALDHGFGPSVDGYGIDDFLVALSAPIATESRTWGRMKAQYR